jgi:hypothetical protein
MSKKVWEEIWINLGPKGIAVNTQYAKPEGQRTGPGGLDETCDGFVKFPSEAQQKLAAKAPEMACELQEWKHLVKLLLAGRSVDTSRNFNRTDLILRDAGVLP